jgi:hypothetical protein
MRSSHGTRPTGIEEPRRIKFESCSCWKAASNRRAIEEVGSGVATDRVFSLLEREFDAKDIHCYQ